MRLKRHFLFLFLWTSLWGMAQSDSTQTQNPERVYGRIVSTSTNGPLSEANIVNLNQVIGTTTDDDGQFDIRAKVNDTLHLSYLGYKSIKVRVTNDWLKFGSAEIEMTELALALEEVVVNQLRLTGYLEVDIRNVPETSNNRYRISGLPNQGYEAGKTSGVNKVLSSIFNPADFLYKMFGKNGRSTAVRRRRSDCRPPRGTC